MGCTPNLWRQFLAGANKTAVFGLVWCAFGAFKSLAPFFWREDIDGGFGVLLHFLRFSAEMVLFGAKKKCQK